MKTILIKNARIINEGADFIGSLLIEDQTIKAIYREGEELPQAEQEIDATGKLLIPGVIDDQVHFREPGLTAKGDIYSESRAAIAGGVTSYMEMPNTKPPTTTIDALEDKYNIAAEKSLVNYSFYMGATNENLSEILKLDAQKVCGVKVFMGSSTGNMLVDKGTALEAIFAEVPMIIATHNEDEAMIQANMHLYKEEYGDAVPWNKHHLIRSAEACYKSSAYAVSLASKYGSRLHILHLSSALEMSLLEGNKPLKDKRITGEVCVHHLWFNNNDYDKYGSRIKWNPAIKTEADRTALREALKTGKLDIVATDHAPHTIEEKSNSYFSAPSGGPLIQHSLVAMMELVQQGVFDYSLVVNKMCHAPADLFRITKRGYLKTGYYADIVLIDPNQNWEVTKENILYKCGWSPFENQQFSHKVTHTFVNGELVYENGHIIEKQAAKRLLFNY